jgi:hypothetical protein
VSPVKSIGVIIATSDPAHVGWMDPDPNVQLPAKAAAGSPAVELLPQPNRKRAAAAPQTRKMDDFGRCMVFSVG